MSDGHLSNWEKIGKRAEAEGLTGAKGLLGKNPDQQTVASMATFVLNSLEEASATLYGLEWMKVSSLNDPVKVAEIMQKAIHAYMVSAFSTQTMMLKSYITGEGEVDEEYDRLQEYAQEITIALYKIAMWHGAKIAITEGMSMNDLHDKHTMTTSPDEEEDDGDNDKQG